uniref:HDC14729 n=1 Tax=Drosophila melanogaster TaxID=7227 RepID=Q6IJK3_DROME|nr:TPA_inf: HDC14729 [Drosophila melanogaster]
MPKGRGQWRWVKGGLCCVFGLHKRSSGTWMHTWSGSTDAVAGGSGLHKKSWFSSGKKPVKNGLKSSAAKLASEHVIITIIIIIIVIVIAIAIDGLSPRSSLNMADSSLRV